MSVLIDKLKIRLPALVLGAITALFWSTYDRYEAAGPVFLEAPSLSDHSYTYGNVEEMELGHIVVGNPVSNRSSHVSFVINDIGSYKQVRVSARLKFINVVKGGHGWSFARLVLAQYGGDGKWLPAPHAVVAKVGTIGWKRYSEEFKILPDTAVFKLQLQQLGASGICEYDQIKVYPVQGRHSFYIWLPLFIIMWIGLAVFYFSKCRFDHRRLRYLILLNAVVILLGALMPSDWLGAIGDKGGAVIESLSMPKASKSKKSKPAPIVSASKKETSSAISTSKVATLNAKMGAFIRKEANLHKWGHYALFASLCFLVYLSAALENQHRIYFVKVGGDIFLFAAVTEALQFLTASRTPGWGDFGIDLLGLFTAVVLFLLIYPLLQWFRRKANA